MDQIPVEDPWFKDLKALEQNSDTLQSHAWENQSELGLAIL